MIGHNCEIENGQAERIIPKNLSVSELKTKLNKRGQPTKGNTSILIERLELVLKQIP